jgi:hypothetical protein
MRRKVCRLLLAIHSYTEVSVFSAQTAHVSLWLLLELFPGTGSLVRSNSHHLMPEGVPDGGFIISRKTGATLSPSSVRSN